MMDAIRCCASGKHIHRLIHCDAYDELRTILESWRPHEVADYRWSRDQHTLLHMLAQRKPKERAARAIALVDWLVTVCKCYVDATNRDNDSPIWLALVCNNAVIAKALIKAGAKLGMWRALTITRHDPLCRVARRSNVKRVLLVAGYPPWEHWHSTWLRQHGEVIKKTVTFIGIWSKRGPFARHFMDRNVTVSFVPTRLVIVPSM